VPGENWFVEATTNQPPVARANSNIYAVVPPADPSDPSIYVVQPQDTLNEIAIEFNRNPNAILAANPQITNPNTLPVGGSLIIPGLQESVLLAPSSGPPGTRIQVAGAGFPPQSKVEIAFGKRGGTYALLETAITNASGLFATQVDIPQRL
jgi:LysM repeat protein